MIPELGCRTSARSAVPRAPVLEHDVLFLDFQGIGNAISLVPLLKCLEATAPTIRYHVINSKVFDPGGLGEIAGLRNIALRVPSIWRRCSREHHFEIIEHIMLHGIGTVINLRNEGPAHDVPYFEFKQRWREQIRFVDLFDVEGERSTKLRLRTAHRAIFERCGIELQGFEPDWLGRNLSIAPCARLNDMQIGFVTAAGQFAKRWSANQWVELGIGIAETLESRVMFSIYAGQSEEEMRLAADVCFQLREGFGADRTKLHAGTDLLAVAAAMQEDSMIIANDTGLLHLAAALGKPVLGLYLSTIGDVWAPDVPWAHVAQSTFGRQCMFQKPGAGNCTYYYGGCPAPCHGYLSVETVLTVARGVLLPFAASPFDDTVGCPQAAPAKEIA